MPEVSISRAVALLAERAPDAVAVREVGGAGTGRVLTRDELDREATRCAQAWRQRVGPDDRVVVSLPNSAAFVVACLAVWRLGATPVPLDPDLDNADRRAVLDAATPVLVVGPALLEDADAEADPPADGGTGADEPLPDRAASSWKGTASGGSTGPPKVVLSTGPARVDPDADVAPYLPRDQVQLVAGPLWASATFTYALRGLMTGHELVVLPGFSPDAVLDAVARHRVTWALLVPTMLHRLARHPGVDDADLSSLATVVHLGAPCPPALKRWWLERLGPERVVEVYASSESAGITMIRGDEWLSHPGSVGRPVGGSSFRVVSADGAELAAGEVGEVLMTRTGGPRYRYLGATPRRMPGWEGWNGLGDLGWLDADGYLYLVDRAADVLTVDGTPVHPARVEAALDAHPAVRSSAVIGLPGPSGDDRVHALLDLDDPSADPAAVVAAVRDTLSPAQVPTSTEAVTGPLRDDAGKLNRRALRAARS